MMSQNAHHGAGQVPDRGPAGGCPWKLIGLAGVAGLVYICFSLWMYAVSPVSLTTAQEVDIPSGLGFKGIERVLVDRGVIADDYRFAVLARLMGATQRLQAGEYRFEPGLTPLRVLAALEAGDVLQRPVTIPEGANIYQIADILSAGGLVERAKFLALAKDRDFIASLGLEAETLEGYLFPDTYFFARGQSVQAIVRPMVDRLLTVLGEVSEHSAVGQELNRHQILTLASIVEKETAIAAERPLIARVFLNRLHKGMRLQADPTVIYGLSDFDGNLTKKDLKTLTPYNTYMIKGLPAGPIGNPGRAAIAAVYHPAEGAYLYFVSKNDGSHYFSKTLAEHNRAVARYQKKRRSRP